jgi:hypothetical protein
MNLCKQQNNRKPFGFSVSCNCDPSINNQPVEAMKASILVSLQRRKYTFNYRSNPNSGCREKSKIIKDLPAKQISKSQFPAIAILQSIINLWKQ